MKENELTTIRINTATRKALLLIGRKGETYDEIIQRLLIINAETS